MEGQNKVGEGIIDEIFSAKLPLLNVNLPFWITNDLNKTKEKNNG